MSPIEAEGREKEPIWPIMGRITGKGSVGSGGNETWRMGVELIIELVGGEGELVLSGNWSFLLVLDLEWEKWRGVRR